ncbi:amidohydrolase [Microbacterium sp. CH12i]|uniref:amidohydrolase family protein n=1 Tax=Microbacterium sp. CH12i TaxID=1479651 RepID=UPI000461AF31|nr:amidohydrolase family protein [Microbacterium sp. CH12i]KDA06757.1 amidohydrolase [Microbacterium sp. CH12i]
MRILDSHLHLWDPAILEYPWLEGPLRARFAETELAAAVGAVDGERAFVFVQADCAEHQTLDEVEWVASLAERVGVRGIVAGARLDRGAESVEHLDAVAQHPLVVGVRHLLQGEPAGLAGSAEFRAGAAALAERRLTFDACVRGAAQLRDVIALATDVPDLRIVLDHLGKPVVGTATEAAVPSTEWMDALTALATHPQVFCKLSGLPAEAGGTWSARQMEPFFDVALDAFGAGRLMVGSDWPVSAVGASGVGDDALDATMISSWTDAVASWAASRELDVDAIMWRNGAGFYGLD